MKIIVSLALIILSLILNSCDKNEKEDIKLLLITLDSISQIDTSSAKFSLRIISSENVEVSKSGIVIRDLDRNLIDTTYFKPAKSISLFFDDLFKGTKYEIHGFAEGKDVFAETVPDTFMTHPFIIDSIFPLQRITGEYIYLYKSISEFNNDTKMFIKWRDAGFGYEDSIELNLTGGAQDALFYQIPASIEEKVNKGNIDMDIVVINRDFYYQYDKHLLFSSIKPYIYSIHISDKIAIFGDFGPYLNGRTFQLNIDDQEFSGYAIYIANFYYYHQIFRIDIDTAKISKGKHAISITMNNYTAIDTINYSK